MRSLLLTLLSTLFLLTLFSGCSPQPQPGAKRTTDPTLPVVHVNGFLNDMTAIAFEWKKINDPRVKGIHIYRRLAAVEGELVRIATVPGREVTHYLDKNVEPGTTYTYRFTSYSADNVESPGSDMVTAATLPLIEPVSFFASIGDMPRSAKLIWRPHPDPRVKSYLLERRSLEEPEWKAVTEINGRLSAEYIDPKLKDDNIYKYRIRAVTYDKLASDPSSVVQVSTKPLPRSVGSVTATTDLPRRIAVSWEPSTAEDFDYYKLYRSESSDDDFDYHVKTRKTRFIDKVNEDGKVYFYKVSAVDKDGLESPASGLPAQGSTLRKPATPVMTGAAYKNRSFRFHWRSEDPRTVSFALIKTTHEGWLKKSIQKISNIKQPQYTDIDIAADTRYEYQVMAVDANGIASEPTEPVELSFSSEE